MNDEVGAKLPVVFFGHGSPTNALETNEATRTWARIGTTIGRPRAILSVSAHWCTQGTAVTAMANPATIHDFGRSLPADLFDIEYPAPGDPELAGHVQELLAPTQVRLDTAWGLDHGTWSVLRSAYPDADIPVVQISLDMTQPGAWHYEIGRRLRPLRDEGVLLMGSGNIVHNLSLMDWDTRAQPYDWAERFHRAVKDCISRDEPDLLCDYGSMGPDAALAVPSPDHYLPLLYVLGAREDNDPLYIAPDFIEYKSLSMSSIYLGNPPLAVAADG